MSSSKPTGQTQARAVAPEQREGWRQRELPLRPGAVPELASHAEGQQGRAEGDSAERRCEHRAAERGVLERLAGSRTGSRKEPAGWLAWERLNCERPMGNVVESAS